MNQNNTPDLTIALTFEEIPVLISAMLSVVTNRRGRISNWWMTPEHFEKVGQTPLWNAFKAATDHMPHSLTDYQKLRFLQEGAYPVFPSCYCGQPVGWLDGKPSEYCSASCAKHSPTKARRISQWHAKADQSAIDRKRQQTMRERYGVAYNSQREGHGKSHLSELASCLLDREWLEREYVEKGRTAVEIAAPLNVHYGTVLYHARQHGFDIRRGSNASLMESSLHGWMVENGVVVERHNRSVLEGLEIDLFVPSHNLGIELNGLYFHGDNFKDRNYHLSKWKKAREKGVDLLFFNEWQFKNKTPIVHSMIASRCGLNRRVFARQCVVREVDIATTRAFTSENHIQGDCGASVRIGLYHGETLLSLMTFGKPRFASGIDWELIRSCTRSGVTVVGGVSKLIAAFRKEHWGTILSYVDAMHGNGNSLIKAGFSWVGHSAPGYVWTDGTGIIPRYKTQHKNLIKWLDGYDPSLSETENMQRAGYQRYWDCGQLKFVLE